MKEIPDRSIDAVITDPPYGIRYVSNMRKRTKGFSMLKNDDTDIRLLAYPEFRRILKPDSVCIVFASWKNVSADFVELSKYFDINNVVVWWKHGGGMGDLKYSLATDYELALICHKGKCRIRGKRSGSVWECNKIPSGKMVHPTQKPEELMERLVEKFTDTGATVLDCFMGSGSTGVACVNTGRKFIGIELDDKYFEIAKQRIDAAVFSLQKNE